VALYADKVAHCFAKEALYSAKEALYSAKEALYGEKFFFLLPFYFALSFFLRTFAVKYHLSLI
jgi:hypothetical protein